MSKTRGNAHRAAGDRGRNRGADPPGAHRQRTPDHLRPDRPEVADTGSPPPKDPDWPDRTAVPRCEARLCIAQNLSGASFFGARIEGAVLIEAKLSGAHLKSVRLEAAVLTNAVHGRYVSSTRLRNAYLFNASLSGANLDGSQLSGALLEKSNLICVVGTISMSSVWVIPSGSRCWTSRLCLDGPIRVTTGECF